MVLVVMVLKVVRKPRTAEDIARKVSTSEIQVNLCNPDSSPYSPLSLYQNP